MHKTNKQTQLSLFLTLPLPASATLGPPPLFGQPSLFSASVQTPLLPLSPSPTSLLVSHSRQHKTLLLHSSSALRHFLGRARVCLETHKLFGHLVVGPLREYPHDCEAGFVHGDALHQRVAGGAAARVGQLSQLDDRHADDAVLAGEAVVLYGDVQLVGLRTVFVTKNTAGGGGG